MPHTSPGFLLVSPFLRVLSSSGFQGDSWVVGFINPGDGTVRAQATCRFAGIALVSNILPLSTRGLLFVRQSVLIPDNKIIARDAEKPGPWVHFMSKEVKSVLSARPPCGAQRPHAVGLWRAVPIYVGQAGPQHPALWLAPVVAQ